MSQLFQLVYVSSASELMSEADLKNLLIAARTRNELRGITGLLLYKQGNIIQAIEGEEAAVRTLMSRIKADSRHRGIIVLYTDYIESRYFPDWAMAYENISNEEIEGYSDFLSLNGSNSEKVIEAGAAKKLLSGFRKRIT